MGAFGRSIEPQLGERRILGPPSGFSDIERESGARLIAARNRRAPIQHWTLLRSESTLLVDSAQTRDRKTISAQP